MPIVPIVASSAGGDLTNLGVVFTQISTWLGDIVDVLIGHPIFLVGLGIFVTGAIIGLGHRLIRG